MRAVKSILRHWLPLAVVTTALIGFAYGSVQQVMRQGANDPQIQIAEEVAAALENGEEVGAVLPDVPLEMERSLAPFVMVFDDTGRLLDTSGLLHGRPPVLPLGVLEHARAHGQNRITWQPEPGVRIAAVVTPYAGDTPGFVLAGRSLREVEWRTSQLGLLAGAAWLATLVASLVAVAFSVLVLGERG